MEQEKEAYIKVVLCEPGKKARITTIKNDLKSLQHAVGDSFIECIYPYNDPVGIVCDEEGKISGKELNRALRNDRGEVYDIIAGPFLVVGLGDEDFASLSKELQGKYLEKYKYPETFCVIGDRIYTIQHTEKEKSRTSKHR